MTRRILIVLVGVGLAMLGNSAAWSEDADQAALIKAISGAKITLLQGIAQVAKGTEVPTEAKYEMEDGKLMLSVYTSAKGFDTAAEDNSFNEYGGDAGLSLGTAIAISGAAVSPNMGYNSSPSITLLLALFNVRLGWWLGNPGKAGEGLLPNRGPEMGCQTAIRRSVWANHG